MHNLTDDGSCVPDQCVQDLDTQVHGQDATAQDPGPTQEHSIDTKEIIMSDWMATHCDPMGVPPEHTHWLCSIAVVKISYLWGVDLGWNVFT